MNGLVELERPLGDLAQLTQLGQRYRAAQPIPHCRIDGLVSDELLDHVVEEFPKPGDGTWNRVADSEYSQKKMISKAIDRQLGPYTKYLVSQLSSPTFLEALEALTGIKGLIPDPYLFAAGLHQIESGGFLEIHSDFASHPKLHLCRRINLLLYLNRDWAEEYQGSLEFWDGRMERCVVKYPPIWNRMLIHNVTARAYHGFVTPIQCPPHMTRKSLAIWYWTSRRPRTEVMDYWLHRPDWMKRPAK